jgi:acyl-coenzyme A thioesterase PaaI-like protein
MEPPSPPGQDRAMDTSFLLSAMPLCATLGIELDAAGPDEVHLRMPWAPEP